jgi:gluconokinase
MRTGTPLTDADRAPWLAALRERIAASLSAQRSAVLACSALRRAYREALVPHEAPSGAIHFVHLRTAPAVLASRLAHRRHHFAPPSLLPSQLAALEEPAVDEHALIVDGARPVADIVDEIIRSIGEDHHA